MSNTDLSNSEHQMNDDLDNYLIDFIGNNYFLYKIGDNKFWEAIFYDLQDMFNFQNRKILSYIQLQERFLFEILPRIFDYRLNPQLTVYYKLLDYDKRNYVKTKSGYKFINIIKEGKVTSLQHNIKKRYSNYFKPLSTQNFKAYLSLNVTPESEKHKRKILPTEEINRRLNKICEIYEEDNALPITFDADREVMVLEKVKNVYDQLSKSIQEIMDNTLLEKIN